MSFVIIRFVILFQLIGGLFSYFAGMLALFQSRCPKSKEWNPLIYSRTEVVVNLFDYVFRTQKVILMESITALYCRMISVVNGVLN